jgi:3-hydroxyisobutyrate dehydrogenase
MKVGFVGLGVMGTPIAARLARAGHSMKVHDLRQTHIPGAAWAESAAAAVADAEVAFTSLPGPAEVEALAAQVAPALARGTAWFDLTTNSPACVRRVHAALAARNVQFLDAPVSGGKEGALSG